ncbi:phage tail spike protein [Weissella cibaria]|uniref:phage tail spike protein n=2 Tax=Weissella cibaria TaxID=137591 RepID=UPI0016482969|nr:phage tail spike protein [Weissella cibaria]MCB5825875.1 phage tail protein [Weissella cibaria]MCB5857434.1 phage tail protein [Weissella cibaria]MCB5859693.1 phage tail protein [Weissella cibaria]MCB5861952.1 phage tail protein [Weissella cibaria]MCB5863674.1 phage tail protein [Weissella cibaria]
MTPILYNSDEIDFTSNGLGQLTELYSVDIQEQRNGLLTFTGLYPVTGQHYGDISEGRIILAKPSPLDDNHAFRIVNTQLDIADHSLQIEADSITYDLTHNIVKSVTMKGTGSTAMNQLQEAIVNPSIFTLYSDITTSSTSTLNYVNPMEAIAGTQGSFLQYWGGEMKRENRRVAMLNRRGRYNVATFRLGKNISGLRYTVDTSNLVTQVIPTVNLTEGNTTRYLEGATVSSKRVGNYPIKYTQSVDVTDKITINDGDTDKAIIDRINAYAGNWFAQSENTNKDLPDVTIEVDVLSLQDSADYADKFAKLETIGLTDTVTVYVPEYGVNVTAIVNELHYDPIGERVTSLVVGTAKVSFADANQNALSDLQNKVIQVQEQATQAVVSANGKNSNHSGRNAPAHPQEGDTWFWDDGADSGIRVFTNGVWVDSVDTKTLERINNAVDSAIETSYTYTDELNDKQVELTNELNDKVANGEALLKQEITDRENGDSVTLQAGKDFVTSQIKDYDTGMQSQISQVSDGIMASVSSTNLITDSSFVNATANWTLAGDVSWKIDNEIMLKGVRVATFNNGSTDFDRKTSTLKSTPIYTMNLGGTQFYASIDIYAQSFGTSAYMKAEIVQKNSSGTTTKTTAIGGSFDTAMSGWNTYTADITLDSATTQLYLQVTQYGGGKISVARPYLGSTKLNAGDYIPGSSTDNTSTLKLFNNFFAFGIQSNTGAIISGINGDSSGLNIVGKKITISGDTTFIGNNFMDGALIKNASIGTAQIADVSITNAKIASLDVNKISGNVSNFIQSNWNGKYGSTTINSTGMTVNSGGVITDFMNSGMKLTMAGESIGGIGVQGMTGKPNTYQGLTFWLDGNAEYMAWAARNNGDTSMNPVIQMSWYRSNSAPTGAYAGFNFDDDVIFNQGINVPGISKAKLGFTTKTFNGFNYPYFGDSRLQAGLAYGSGYTYLISGTTYYNLTRVIKALDNLGAVKIPSVINSDGTVKTWFNVTL